jgi:hypothetical protein
LEICFPFWRTDFDGGLAFLGMPRLYLSIALCLFSYSLLAPETAARGSIPARLLGLGWVLAGGLTLQVATNLHHLHGIYERSEERMLTSLGAFLAAEPLANRDSTLFILMLSDGYHADERTHQGVHYSDNEVDRLAVAAREERIWVEESGQESRIVSVAPDLTSGRLEVDNAESPVVSGDGKWLAYLRSNRRRKRIWLRAPLEDAATADEPLTPPGLNVFEMAFLRDNSIVFAAAEDHHVPRLFRTNGPDQLRSVADEPARYPAISPDGRWLAYSRRSGGVWNLWLRNLGSEQEIRVTRADCMVFASTANAP